MGTEAEIIGQTDRTGKFQTSPPTLTSPILLMPGHALTLYRAETWHPEHGTLLLAAYGTKNMRTSEMASMGTLFLDSEPNSIAPPSTPEGIPHHELQNYLYPHHLLGECDQQLSQAALAYTNSFRKLNQMPRSTFTTEYSQAGKAYASHLWAATYASCPPVKSNHLDRVFERIFAEVGHWPEVVTHPLSATGEQE
ncbi:hypothetical protein M5M_00910 [Simiduia agarivorans SA1 = DSM 21679]|uniref:Uncharacterized protein n=2 Tax=Simiduia TaxID=447467 RepID=K4KGS7_SIMAS|nr:hypothetical protein M5M_00910 [Simiduia agarivorans SA1 = DSM 21679]